MNTKDTKDTKGHEGIRRNTKEDEVSPDAAQKTGEFQYGRFTEPVAIPGHSHVFSISFVLILFFLRVLRVDEVACK
jgi:hypothetical protein